LVADYNTRCSETRFKYERERLALNNAEKQEIASIRNPPSLESMIL